MTAPLRRMISGDLPAVLDLERALFPEDAWTSEMFAAELSGRAAGRYYLVAEEDGQIVGYAGLLAPEPGRGRPGLRRSRPEPGGQADVLTMAVAPGQQDRGIGSALLQALLAEAAARDCTEVFLEVRVDNPRAQRLYRRHGFAAVGVRRGYYQPSGTDALVMRRPADAATPAPAEGDPASAGGAAGQDPAPAADAAEGDPAAAGGRPAAPRTPERQA